LHERSKGSKIAPDVMREILTELLARPSLMVHVEVPKESSGNYNKQAQAGAASFLILGKLAPNPLHPEVRVPLENPNQ